jgi:hypothetical protein
MSKAVSPLDASRKALSLFVEIADLVRNLAASLFDPYRPELHYMRGPGPKWHAKHDPAPTTAYRMTPAPALVRVRVRR